MGNVVRQLAPIRTPKSKRLSGKPTNCKCIDSGIVDIDSGYFPALKDGISR